MRKTGIILVVLVLFALISTVSAQEIKFDTDCKITVIHTGGSAGYNNAFGWVSGGTPPAGTLNYLGTGNLNQPYPDDYPIGPILPAGEDFYLYITTNENPTRTYYSEPASANPDTKEHVQVTQIDANAYLVAVGFEDLYNLPSGNGEPDYNDLYLQVNCDQVITPPPVPEFPTMALPVALIIGMLGAVLFIRKSKEG